MKELEEKSSQKDMRKAELKFYTHKKKKTRTINWAENQDSSKGSRNRAS